MLDEKEIVDTILKKVNRPCGIMLVHLREIYIDGRVDELVIRGYISCLKDIGLIDEFALHDEELVNEYDVLYNYCTAKDLEDQKNEI